MTNKLRSYIINTLAEADRTEDDRDLRRRLDYAVQIAEISRLTCSELPRNHRVVVSAYAVVRRYGGREEGGWWYDCFTHIESSRPIRPARVPHQRARLFLRHQHVVEGAITSVLGGTELWIGWEFAPGEMATRERPQYA